MMLEKIVGCELVSTVFIDSELSADEIDWAKLKLRKRLWDALGYPYCRAFEWALARGIPEVDVRRLFHDRLYKELSLISLAGYLLLGEYSRVSIVRYASCVTISFE